MNRAKATVKNYLQTWLHNCNPETIMSNDQKLTAIKKDLEKIQAWTVFAVKRITELEILNKALVDENKYLQELTNKLFTKIEK
jgi:hypothetical protein